MSKKCVKCSLEDSEKNFPKDKSRKDGIFPYCKLCRSQYRKEDHSRIKLYMEREWFIKNYINLQKDFRELSKIANCGYNTIRRWRKKLKIPIQDKHRNYRKRFFTSEHRNKISLSRKGKYTKEENHNWKGGITKRMELLRKSPEYKKFVQAVLKRDWYKCLVCPSKKELEVHHIYPRRDFPERIFDIDNGITLCKKCHGLTFYKEYNFIEKFLDILSKQSMAKVTV